MATYWEMLKHPKWQRKRLEILERDAFTCQDCGSSTNTLHVHHTYYERKLKPWDYPNESLRTLCETCHESAQDDMTQMQRALVTVDSSSLKTVIGYAAATGTLMEPRRTIPCRSYEEAVGIGAAWLKPASAVIAACSQGRVSYIGVMAVEGGR